MGQVYNLLERQQQTKRWIGFDTVVMFAIPLQQCKMVANADHSHKTFPWESNRHLVDTLHRILVDIWDVYTMRTHLREANKRNIGFISIVFLTGTDRVVPLHAPC